MWQNLTNAGIVQSGIGDVGQYFIQISGTRKAEMYPGSPNGAIVLANQTPIYWKNNTASNAGSADIGVCRNDVGVLEIDDANCNNAFRDLKLRFITGTTGGLFYDPTPTTGNTTLTVRAGAGQSDSLFNFRSSAAVLESTIGGDGSFNQWLSSVRKLVASGSIYGASSDSAYCWKNNTNWDAGGAAIDTCISRNAAGTVEFNNGTPGTYRDAILRTLKRSVLTVATLPGTPADGDMVWINDSADGSCVNGGGAIRVQCIYNGTSWIAH